MATGITIDEVTNTLDDIQGTEKIPVSSGISEPEVVTTGDLKEYINDGMQEEISDLSTIRSGASAGATAYQKPSSGIPSTDLASAVQASLGKADTALQSFTETDPTVPSWAKQLSKPSYNYSEISGTPTLANVATSGSYNDLTDKPSIPDISNCIQKSSTSGLVKNDGTIDTNSYITSAHEVPGGGNAGQVLKKTTGTDYDYAWSSITETYPSAYCSTAGGTALKVANCTLWAATANTYLHILMGAPNTYQGELKLKVNGNPSASGATIYINGVVSSSTNYTLPAGSYIIFYDGTYFHFRTDGRIPYVVHTSSTSGLMKNDGSVDTNTYLTSHQDISGKENTSNKVTSLSSSSTDTQYPSAKCVYDLIGDIETLLAAI